MSSTDVPVKVWIKPEDTIRIVASVAAIYIVYLASATIYDVYFGPLSKYPGPKLWAATRLLRIRAMVTGREGAEGAALHQKYGPVVRVGPNDLSYASGAEAFKDVYGFKKSNRAHPYKDPVFYGKPFNNVHSVISANDEGHSRQRKILSHAFSDKALKEQEPLLKKWSMLMDEKLGERAVANEKLDLLKYYNCTTFDVMGDLTFSEGLNMLNDSAYSPWVKAIFAGIKIATFFRGIKIYSRWTDWLVEQLLFKNEKVRQKQKEHWDYSQARVDRRLKREPEHPDLWTKILEKGEQEDGGLSLGEHHSTASLFMIAGTETTATALSGTTYHLLRNPETLRKLTDEVRGAFADFDDITLEGMARLKYLHAVLQEGLRIYPPVPIALPRLTPAEGTTVCGEFVPGGTIIGVSQLATYRMEENFKHPYEFHPERWLGDPEFKDDQLAALEPFSVGPRNCLGKNLAWHEMRMLLVTVLLHYDLQLCEESSDWSDQKIFTLWEKKPLMCTLKAVGK